MEKDSAIERANESSRLLSSDSTESPSMIGIEGGAYTDAPPQSYGSTANENIFEASSDNATETTSLLPSIADDILKSYNITRHSTHGDVSARNKEIIGGASPIRVGHQLSSIAPEIKLSTPHRGANVGSKKWGLDDFGSDSKKNTPISYSNPDMELGIGRDASLVSNGPSGMTGQSSQPSQPSRKPPANRLAPASAASTNNSSSNSSKSNAPASSMSSSSICLGILVFGVFAALSLLGFMTLRHSIEQQSRKLQGISARIDELKSDLSKYKVETDSKFLKINNDLKYIQDQEVQLESFAKREIGQTKSDISSVQSEQSATWEKITSLAGDVKTHDSIISRLNNRTSNAEVLDQLKLTKKYVASERSYATD